MGQLQFEDEVESLRRSGPMDDRDVALLFAADKLAEQQRVIERYKQALQAVVDHMIARTDDEGEAYDEVLAALELTEGER